MGKEWHSEKQRQIEARALSQEAEVAVITSIRGYQHLGFSPERWLFIVDLIIQPGLCSQWSSWCMLRLMLICRNKEACAALDTPNADIAGRADHGLFDIHFHSGSLAVI